MRRTRLKEAREAAGLTQEQVAEAVGADRTSIGRWERGDTTPTPDQRSTYADALGVSLQELHAMLSSLPTVDDETPAWLVNYLAAEQSADSLRSHEPRAIFGLFQTPGYAGAVVRTVGVDGAPDSYVERSIEQRVRRQKRVRSGDVELDVIQPEWVLHLQMGTPEVMAEQLDTMVDLAGQDNVTVRIAPYSSGQYEAMRLGDFIIMAHSWGNPRVHIEGYGGGRFISQGDEVSYFATAFDRACTTSALSPAESVDYIRQIADEWRARA